MSDRKEDKLKILIACEESQRICTDAEQWGAYLEGLCYGKK